MSGMDRLTELLPCPFCGGAPTLALGRGAYGVNCNCKGEAFIQTYGGGFVTTGFTREQAKENAIAAWNRRASQAAPAPSDGLREADRFGCDQLGMDKMPDGEWVRFTDYQALCERAEAAERDRDEAEAALRLLAREIVVAARRAAPTEGEA